MSEFLSYAENLGSGLLNSAPAAHSLEANGSQVGEAGAKDNRFSQVSGPSDTAKARGNISSQAEQSLYALKAAVSGERARGVVGPVGSVRVVPGKFSGYSTAGPVPMADHKKVSKYAKVPSPDISKSIVPLKTPEEYAKHYKSKSSTGKDKESPGMLLSSMGTKASKASSKMMPLAKEKSASSSKGGQRSASFKLGAAVKVDYSDDSADSTDDSDFGEQHNSQRAKEMHEQLSEPPKPASLHLQQPHITYSQNPPQPAFTLTSDPAPTTGNIAPAEVPIVSSDSGPGAMPVDPAGTVQYYQCDACDSYPLTVCRYHCLVCSDYDLCETCFKEGTKEHDSSHAMERLNIEKAIQKVNGSAAEPTTVTAVAQDTVPPKKTTEKEELEETKETGSAAQAQTTGAVAHKPRRRIRPVKAAAGAAMDMMKLTLERCGIGAVRDGATSTRSAQLFNSCFEAGERVFKERGVPFSTGSLYGKVVALNAMVLSGLPPHTPKHGKARPQTRTVSHEDVQAMALSLCEQFIISDAEEWFTSPVDPEEVPEYYEQIEVPMDLNKILAELKQFDYMVKPVYTPLALLNQRLDLMWKNAKAFNGAGHPVHKRAIAMDSATTRIMVQTKVALGFKDVDFRAVEIPIAISKTVPQVKEQEHAKPVSPKPASAPSTTGRGRKRKRVAGDSTSATVTTSTSTPVVSVASKETMTARVTSPKASSKEASLRAEVDRLKKELERANARIDDLCSIMKGGLTKMASEVTNMR